MFLLTTVINPNKIRPVKHKFQAVLDFIQRNDGKIQELPKQLVNDIKVTSIPSQEDKKGYQNCALEMTARDFTIRVDEPNSNGGDNKALTPVEYLVASVVSCLQINFNLICSLNGVRLDRLEATGSAKLDRRFVVDQPEKFPPRIDELVIEMRASGTERETVIRKLLKKAIRTCPVKNSLHPGIKVDIQLDYKKHER